jgi:hypothetical protein
VGSLGLHVARIRVGYKLCAVNDEVDCWWNTWKRFGTAAGETSVRSKDLRMVQSLQISAHLVVSGTHFQVGTPLESSSLSFSGRSPTCTTHSTLHHQVSNHDQKLFGVEDSDRVNVPLELLLIFGLLTDTSGMGRICRRRTDEVDRRPWKKTGR